MVVRITLYSSIFVCTVAHTMDQEMQAMQAWKTYRETIMLEVKQKMIAEGFNHDTPPEPYKLIYQNKNNSDVLCALFILPNGKHLKITLDSSELSTSEHDTDNDYKKMHAQLIRQKYTTLSPIKWQEHEGYIYAYYSPQEKKTRILITRKNNVYEKASIDTDQDIKTPLGEIDLQGYKGLLHAYESCVERGSFEQLSLKQ